MYYLGRSKNDLQNVHLSTGMNYVVLSDFNLKPVNIGVCGLLSKRMPGLLTVWLSLFGIESRANCLLRPLNAWQ